MEECVSSRDSTLDTPRCCWTGRVRDTRASWTSSSCAPFCGTRAVVGRLKVAGEEESPRRQRALLLRAQQGGRRPGVPAAPADPLLRLPPPDRDCDDGGMD